MIRVLVVLGLVCTALATPCYVTLQAINAPSYGVPNNTYLASLTLEDNAPVQVVATLDAPDLANVCTPSSAFANNGANVVLWVWGGGVAGNNLLGYVYSVPSGKFIEQVDFGAAEAGGCPEGQLFTLPGNIWCVYAELSAQGGTELRCNTTSTTDFEVLWTQPDIIVNPYLAPVGNTANAPLIAIIYASNEEAQVSIVNVATGAWANSTVTHVDANVGGVIGLLITDTATNTALLVGAGGKAAYTGTGESSAGSGGSSSGAPDHELGLSPLSSGGAAVAQGMQRGAAGAREDGRRHKTSGSSYSSSGPYHAAKEILYFYSVTGFGEGTVAAKQVDSLHLPTGFMANDLFFNGDEWIAVTNGNDEFYVYSFVPNGKRITSTQFGPFSDPSFNVMNGAVAPFTIYCPAGATASA